MRGTGPRSCWGSGTWWTGKAGPAGDLVLGEGSGPSRRGADRLGVGGPDSPLRAPLPGSLTGRRPGLRGMGVGG